MSSLTPAPSPSPWLAPPFLLTAVLVLVGFGTTWGVLTARQDAADRARVEDRAELKTCMASQASLTVRIATSEGQQESMKRLLDSEIAGLRREMERMAKALERLTEDPISRHR